MSHNPGDDDWLGSAVAPQVKPLLYRALHERRAIEAQIDDPGLEPAKRATMQRWHERSCLYVPLIFKGQGLPIEEFAQTDQNMTRACQRLFDAVAEERVRHGGDPVLEEYVLNAAVKTGRQGGFRFTKPDAEAKIDGAIALAMAVDVAEAEAGQGGIGVVVF